MGRAAAPARRPRGAHPSPSSDPSRPAPACAGATALGLRQVSPNPWADRDLAIVIDVDGASASASDKATDLEKLAAAAKAEAEAAAREAADAAAALTAARAASAAAANAASAAANAAGIDPRSLRPRTWYVDWLRTFLTLVVVLHHCVSVYLGSGPWAGKSKGDNALWLLSQLFVGGNQAYFMTLFFFISGIYVPSSYNRKGAWVFLKDRTLRLVLPVLVYSLLIPPFNNWWGGYVKDPSKHPSIGDAFQKWFKPGWPTTYILPTGPPWFCWMLWCFNVAYVIIRSALGTRAAQAVISRARRCACAGGAAVADDSDKKPKAHVKHGRYTGRQFAAGAAAVTMALFVTCYCTRMIDVLVFNIKPSTFVQRGPFVQFMPDYLPVYIIAFALGTFSGPRSSIPALSNLLARLPRWGGYCLAVGGIWWVQAGWLPNTVLHSLLSGTKGDGVMAACWILRTFVEQSFCVIWSCGLLMSFRDVLNKRPNTFGEIINGAAYAAFLIHWPIVQLYAASLISFWYPSAAVNAVAISAPVVFTAWLLGAGLKAIPGAHRIL